jgi:hypothetical protein
MLSGDDHSPLGMVESTNEFRISIAGAQEKTALLWYQNQWCRPLGAAPTSLTGGVSLSEDGDICPAVGNLNELLLIDRAFPLPQFFPAQLLIESTGRIIL